MSQFTPDPERLRNARVMMREVIAQFDIAITQLDELTAQLDKEFEEQQQRRTERKI